MITTKRCRTKARIHDSTLRTALRLAKSQQTDAALALVSSIDPQALSPCDLRALALTYSHCACHQKSAQAWQRVIEGPGVAAGDYYMLAAELIACGLVAEAMQHLRKELAALDGTSQRIYGDAPALTLATLLCKERQWSEAAEVLRPVDALSTSYVPGLGVVSKSGLLKQMPGRQRGIQTRSESFGLFAG